MFLKNFLLKFFPFQIRINHVWVKRKYFLNFFFLKKRAYEQYEKKIYFSTHPNIIYSTLKMEKFQEKMIFSIFKIDFFPEN